jgi:transcriptional regulator GlxA family with amidase domain
VLLIPAGCWHRYRPIRAVGWREVWCTVNGEYLHRLRAQGGFPRAPLLRRLTDPSAFLAAMQRLHDNASVNSLLVESCALEAIARALEDNEVSHRGYEPAVTGTPVVDRALEYIWLNSHRPINVTDVAATLGTTRRRLERHFQRSHERSVAEELTWCRIERAKILLTESRMSAKEVSYATGFGDPKRMTRAFQAKVGTSPHRFRTRLGVD